MRKTVHIISHSHWDREWYLPFEKHRMRLIELMDDSMDLFENDPEFKNFHLDGQTIILDDYLEIKPQMKEKLREYIEKGQFHVGPWYVLQDEFFTSGESNVRNLLTGMREAENFGRVCKIGYFPDAFGNVGQMPQILRQAGMEAVVFGRGVNPVGFDNNVKDGDYESKYSEMNWESPDGSSLLGILFANWYNNGWEIPVEEKAAKKFWDDGLAKAERFAGTSQLLFMNGCDHQPVQKDLSAAMETARKLYPDIEFIHSDFETYIKAVKEELKEDVSVVKGELTSQETDGYWTLVNTASSHVGLKVQNRQCETALERMAEPMAVTAALFGKKYPREFLRYSWKMLMQNHPHDSICGCSVDEVNREMKTRFDKSFQVAQELYAESQTYMADKIDTRSLPESEGKQRFPFAVFNTTGWKRSGTVRVTLDLARSIEGGLAKSYECMKQMLPGDFCVKDAEGAVVEAKIEDVGVGFGYTLPKDRFRQPYMARQIAVTLEAVDVPAFGHTVYFVEEKNAVEGDEMERAAGKKCATEGSRKECRTTLVIAENIMENEFLRVEIHEDGSYTLTDKENGHSFERIGWLEDTGDIGNEYIYVRPKNSPAVTTVGTKAEIRLLEDEPYRAVYEISHKMEVPVSADDTFEEEKKSMADVFGRKAGRSSETVILPVTIRLILEKNAKAVRAETTICNTAKDHRIRVMIPTGLEADTHFADSVFEVAERNNHHSPMWKNPSGCEHQQNFVAMCDDNAGILVANIGLYEYEVLPEMVSSDNSKMVEKNVIAVTLLRVVSEMGDWGVFPTEEAQLQGTYTVSYEIVPFTAGKESEAYREAYQFQTELTAQQTGVHSGILPLTHSMFSWEGEGLNFTGLKMAEDRNDVIARFVNNTKHVVTLKFRKQPCFTAVYKSNVIETVGEEISENQDGYQIEIKPFEIVTIGLVRNVF